MRQCIHMTKRESIFLNRLPNLTNFDTLAINFHNYSRERFCKKTCVHTTLTLVFFFSVFFCVRKFSTLALQTDMDAETRTRIINLTHDQLLALLAPKRGRAGTL